MAGTHKSDLIESTCARLGTQRCTAINASLARYIFQDNLTSEGKQQVPLRGQSCFYSPKPEPCCAKYEYNQKPCCRKYGIGTVFIH